MYPEKAIFMKMVYTMSSSLSRLPPINYFNPTFSHQVFKFSENELDYFKKEIFQMVLFINPYSYDVWLYINYAKLAELRRRPIFYLNMCEAWKLQFYLLHEASTTFNNGKLFVDTFKESQTKFLEYLNGESFGRTFATFILSVDTEVEIRFIDRFDPTFRDYYDRFQSFMLWFIETANKIDYSEGWNIFLIIKTVRRHTICSYCCGAVTVYETRQSSGLLQPRLSQMLIMPPEQKRGIGYKTLFQICKYYNSKPNTTYLQVEKPSKNFKVLWEAVHLADFLTLDLMVPEILTTHWIEEQMLRSDVNRRFSRKAFINLLELQSYVKRHANMHDILSLSSLTKFSYRNWTFFDPELKKFRLDANKKQIVLQNKIEKIKRILKLIFLNNHPLFA